ncbi:MAG: hypothetical protein J6J67_06200 [Treponema sp.]|nr:hypothetical protein [Treponema sp.]
MFFTYKDCIEVYKNDYFLEKAVQYGKLSKVEKGIYSNTETWRELALIVFKNKNAIFTMNSAFYYQDLTDSIPQYYYLGTDRNAFKIKDTSVKQVFYQSNILMLGVEEKVINGTQVKLYSKERLLIELIRHRNKLPFDYYKEIITNYRNKIFELDEEWIEDNIEKFPSAKKIMNTIQLEVY